MTEKLQPQLRFPEFKEDWEKTTLGKLMRFKNGVNAPKEQYGTGYKFINVLDIINNKAITHEKIIGSVNISEKEFDKNIVEYGDILFQRSSETREEVGQSNVYLDKVIPSTFGGFVIRGKKINDYDSLYIHYLLKTTKARVEITTKSGGSTRYNVGQDTLSNVVISKSVDLFEHQKIADYLSSIEKKISLLEEKKTALSSYKKGIMQQLFSQQIRFKDEKGNEFPDWEKKRLGEVGYFQTSSVDKLYIENEKEVYLINYMNVYRHETINNETINSFQIVTATDTQIKSSDVRKGDILFTPSSETPSDIGHSVVIFEDIKDAVFSYHLMRFRPSIELHLMYSHYFCNISKVLNQLTKYATGSTRFTISVKSFSAISVDIPSIPEQQKISDFLSSLDESIDKVNKQIIHTQVFFKAMLQQMFM